MTSLWWRSWHGAPTDSKWLAVAKRAGVAPGMVSAFAWALFDHASQQEDARGCVEGFDIESYAAFSGFSEDDISAIWKAMDEKGMIESGKLVSWEKRQPKREDHSTERVQKHRNALKRSETRGNAILDKIRLEKKESVHPINLEFEKFKRAYPKRLGAQGWPRTQKLFEAATKSGVPPQDLVAAASKFSETIPKNTHGTEFIPMAQTWMGQEQWREFIPTEADKKRIEEREAFLAAKGFGKPAE